MVNQNDAPSAEATWRRRVGRAVVLVLALTALGHPTGPEAAGDPQAREALREEGASLIVELQKLRAAAMAGSWPNTL